MYTIKTIPPYGLKVENGILNSVAISGGKNLDGHCLDTGLNGLDIGLEFWTSVHVSTYMSCHKAIVVITGRSHCFHDFIYIYINRKS